MTTHQRFLKVRAVHPGYKLLRNLFLDFPLSVTQNLFRKPVINNDGYTVDRVILDCCTNSYHTGIEVISKLVLSNKITTNK